VLRLQWQGETGPFILLGDMDGGPDRIYEYALARPENVVALIPMQYCIPEMLGYQRFHNWTYEQTRAYAKATITQRRNAGDIIRGFGAVWGVSRGWICRLYVDSLLSKTQLLHSYCQPTFLAAYSLWNTSEPPLCLLHCHVLKLIPLFAPVPTTYVPADRARESIFLKCVP
jgi:hypothetical protein